MRQSPETVRKLKELYRDKKLPLNMRGKEFGLREFRVIHQCIEANFEDGRTKISEEVCRRLDWRQPNGWLKDRACRDVLLKMEAQGLIELPPTKASIVKKSGAKQSRTVNYLDDFDLESPITVFPGTIKLDFAKGNERETIWNQLVDRYHYLGHTVSVGRTIKYIIRSEDRLLGAISFSSASWNLNSRNEILHLLGYPVEVHREIVINNTRFLILPNVSVKNLASKILSISTFQVVQDWSWYYSIAPEIVETFVEPSRFDGTCYRAANWIEIGSTKGYAKKGPSFHNGQEPKLIFIYGLNKAIRRRLNSLFKNLHSRDKI